MNDEKRYEERIKTETDGEYCREMENVEGQRQREKNKTRSEEKEVEIERDRKMTTKRI